MISEPLKCIRKKINKAKNHVLVLQYFEMDFDADVCDPKSDFDAFQHVYGEPLENNEYALSFAPNTIVSPYQ